MPLTDWEIWACAQQIVKQHGAKAPAHVATRIGELASAGNTEAPWSGRRLPKASTS